MKDFDFLVIGGGSAGYNGAVAACELGLRVGVIDGAEELGGLCILRGCMPSKTLLESANRYMTLRRASEFGLRAGPIAFHGDEIMARKNRLVGEFARYRAKQLQAGRFELLRGWAMFIDPHTVEIRAPDGATRRVTSETFLLATGSHLGAVPLPGLAETGFLTSDDVLASPQVPQSVIILGGGAIAVEFAAYFSAFESQVTIVQRSEHLMKEMDGDVAEALAKASRARGMKVFCHTRLLCAERGADGLKRVVFQQAGKTMTVEAEEIFYALGRQPCTEGLELERAGVDLTHGRLKVSPTQQTCVPHIFAAGDVAGPYEIVHIAIQQAELAARNAIRIVKGLNDGGTAAPRRLDEIDYRLRLFAVFSSPEIAMVGLTERELESQALPYNVACCPFNDHGKSLVHGETEGFVKLLASEASGEIVGAAVIGPHASELIHEIVVAMRFRATARDLAQIPHYHPTLSEIWTYPAEELAQK